MREERTIKTFYYLVFLFLASLMVWIRRTILCIRVEQYSRAHFLRINFMTWGICSTLKCTLSPTSLLLFLFSYDTLSFGIYHRFLLGFRYKLFPNHLSTLILCFLMNLLTNLDLWHGTQSSMQVVVVVVVVVETTKRQPKTNQSTLGQPEKG